MNKEQVAELLYQALETEKGGVTIYETALRCAMNDDLKKEWEEYLEQTRTHEEIVLGVLQKLGLDPDTETPGRQVVRHTGESLVKAMEMALEEGTPEAAQIVAAECVVLAETKDHLNWELIHETANKLKGDEGKALKEAYEQVEEQEDEHLYHTTGWCRELWIESLGMPAVLPSSTRAARPASSSFTGSRSWACIPSCGTRRRRSPAPIPISTGVTCGRRSSGAPIPSTSLASRSSTRRTSSRTASICWTPPSCSPRSWCRCGGSSPAGAALFLSRHPAHASRRSELRRDPDQPSGGARAQPPAGRRHAHHHQHGQGAVPPQHRGRWLPVPGVAGGRGLCPPHGARRRPHDPPAK